MTTVDSSTQSYTGIDDLAVDLADGVLSVTMNRPDSLNSLTAAMFTTIADTLERAASDARVKVVRLGGAGRGFSSGAGIGEDDQAQKTVDGPASVIDAANRAVRSIVKLAAAGGCRRTGTVRGCRCLPGAGVRCRIGFGEGLFHAGVHEDRLDARRWSVGVDRRGGRSHPRHADGPDGRADFRHPKRTNGVWSRRCIQLRTSTPRWTR